MGLVPAGEERGTGAYGIDEIGEVGGGGQRLTSTAPAERREIVTEIRFGPIGHVRSAVTEQRDDAWGAVTARLELLPEFAPGLTGLEAFSHAVVLTYLHEAAFDPGQHLRRKPRGLEHLPRIGIFAQRAKDRPNPIGVTAVRILGVAEGALLVRGLDAIDGTPILDIKPYVPEFDRVDDATAPTWLGEIMQGYFSRPDDPGPNPE